ncbi:MAG TPA: DUF4440 domain-containing protein, partial [Dongiaceae bacterium]|nr:DUF4440 domain-containing protein [Dongiaceae bacterium]
MKRRAAGLALSLAGFSIAATTPGAASPAAPAPAAQATVPATPSVSLPPELTRILTDYENAWHAKDARALAALFAEDGFVLSSGEPPARGRAAIERLYTGRGGPLALRAIDSRVEGSVGYILGGFARHRGEPDIGKFTLTIVKGAGGRWFIQSDMDNGNGPGGGAGTPPAPAGAAGGAAPPAPAGAAAGA